MSILKDIREATNESAAAPAGKPARKTSEFWLNVGVNIPGGGKDGEDIFVSLPIGLALDDMKPQSIRGQNEDWIHLAQTKNALLEAVQKRAATLKAGERVELEGVSVEVYRKADPDQVGSAATNPLLAAMLGHLGAPKSE